jgi:hypothetical protein
MSFKQKSSPLRQVSPIDIANAMAQKSPAEIALANSTKVYDYGVGAAARKKEQLLGALGGRFLGKTADSIEKEKIAAANAARIKSLAGKPLDLNAIRGQQPATPAATTINSVTPTVNRSSGRALNFFGTAATINTVGNGPQSTVQNNTTGWNRRDSHNTDIYDRLNGGNRYSTNNPGGRSSMFSPFPQLKNEQMEYNKISPKAFSNSGTIEKMMGKAVPNSPFMQMVDPLTGLTIDPTMSQDPNAPLPPPAGVQTPTTPIYDINNY